MCGLRLSFQTLSRLLTDPTGEKAQITEFSGTSEEEEDKSLYWLFCYVLLFYLDSHHFSVHQAL